MKATPIFDEDFKKWIVEVEIHNGEKVPVGKTENEKLGTFKISKWDTKEQAIEWIESKGIIVSLPL